MAFTARTRTTIRSALLSALTARYSAAGKTLAVEYGSDAYWMADALSVELLQLESAAEALSHEILPDEAIDLLDRHASVYAITRRAAVKAILTVAVTGTPSTTPAIPAGSKMSSPGGALFTVSDASVALNGSGNGTLSVVTADAGGAAGTLAVSTVLTWQSAPAGLNPTGTVASITTAGEDEETDDTLRTRLLDRLRQRPASGNAEDWREWTASCDGITDAYVYQRLQPGTTSGEVLGCVTVVAVGPAQGTSITNTRVVGSTRCDQIEDFINGTRNAAGVVVTDGVQLRPVTQATADFEVTNLVPTTQNVTLAIKNSARYPFPFTGTMTENGSTPTTLVVTGDHTAKNGKRALVKVGTGYARGAFQAVDLSGGTYNGGTNKTTWTITTLLTTPVAASLVYPAPANWDAMKTALFTLFDSLGPKDTAALQRYPTEDVRGRATLYLSAMASALQAVPGVVSVTFTTPGVDQTPANAKMIIELAELVITEIP